NRSGSGQLAVVVVVPGRYREHDSIASIDRELVGAEQAGPGTAGDQDRCGGNVEAELAGIERRDLLPKRRNPRRRWVVRLSPAKRTLHALEERPRNGELARVEVADGQVTDLLPAGLERPNLVGDRQNARPGQAGEAAAGLR